MAVWENEAGKGLRGAAGHPPPNTPGGEAPRQASRAHRSHWAGHRLRPVADITAASVQPAQPPHFLPSRGGISSHVSNFTVLSWVGGAAGAQPPLLGERGDDK